MRAFVAAGLALVLLVAAAGPHVHTAAHGDESCAVCVARHADVPRAESPDLTPVPIVEAAPQLAPRRAPVTGAPLGAVPGQSPPSYA
jgi:hypothetical protein